MAVYMLYAAVALVWAAALYSLYLQLHEFKAVWPVWKSFKTQYPTHLKVQTNNGMLFLCLFMMAMGLVLGWMETEPSVRFCFCGVSVLFASYTLKNLMTGRLYWSADRFLWKNHIRAFRSITRFDDLSRTSTEIQFQKEEPLVVPEAVALQIRTLKTRQAAMRIKIKKSNG